MAYSNLGRHEESLEDADACIKIKPDWGKGYQRKGTALQKLGKNGEAMEAYSKGLEIDPANNAMKTALDEMQAANESKLG